jgi:rubrerythrin
MEDLISRKEALKALREIFVRGNGLRPATADMINAIKFLPSAEPKKGQWIFTRYYVWECSECGKNPTIGMGYIQRRSELFRYCPNCGAKMEVTE